MRLKVQREVTFEKVFEAEEVLRRFPIEWREFKEREDIQDDDEIYDDDLRVFLIELADDMTWEEVFGAQNWTELEQTDIWEVP